MMGALMAMARTLPAAADGLHWPVYGSSNEARPKQLKVLLISVNFAPEPTGIGKYSGDMAAWLAAHGHDVRAVAALPYYPMWKVHAAYSPSRYRRESWRGVDVWRAPLWVPARPGGWARVLHLMSFAVTSFPLILRQIIWRPDLVLTVAPALVCAPSAWLVARLCGAESWLHIQDFEVDVAFQMGLLRGALLKRIVLRMERSLLRRFDTVSTISRRMIELLIRKGVPAERTRYFPNWVKIAESHSSTDVAYRAELNIGRDTVVALFSGTLGGKQGLTVIPDAARLLASRKDVVFVICGDGLLKPRLEAAIADLSNIRLLPLQPIERLAEFLSMADIHLLPQSPGAADLVLPSKLSGMLASGRPVIATCQPGTEIADIVSNCGLVVAPKDSRSLADAIIRLTDDPVLRQSLGRKAREFANANFERDAVLEGVFAQCLADEPAVVNDVVA
jgi:colanic acid biosynthesis glycosyl transferase WcaI